MGLLLSSYQVEQMKSNYNFSSYFFIGRLSDSTSRFYILEEVLPMDFRFEVYMDSVYIWGTTDLPFDKLLPIVIDIYKTLVAAYIFKTNKPISVTLNNWVEAQGVTARRNMIGWFVPPTHTLGKVSSRRSKINTPWKKAALFVRNQNKFRADHRLALKDYSTAITEPSQDAYLFAYRAIEDVCRAINGGVDELESDHWDKFQKRLNISKASIDPLKEVADKIRHGNNLHTLVKKAEQNREKFILIAHDVLSREFKQILKSF